MKANELKIGSLVEACGVVCQVHSITENAFYCRPTEKSDYKKISAVAKYDFQPIPLTEEWLLKFGFERKIGWDDLIYYAKNNVDLYEFLSGYEYCDFHIKHVHQLQNLYFALTGEELKLLKDE